jgi:tripartite-type tricarboxylate transporter receptor subunit TctC
MHRRTAILAAARGLATTLSSASAAWPDRPIKLVVPYAPGGSTDQFGRGIAEGVSRELKQPVLVENRPGANTMIGTQSVARAQPDGYTVLLVTSASMVLNPMLYKKPGYEPQEFKIITVGVEAPLCGRQQPGAVQQHQGVRGLRQGCQWQAQLLVGGARQLAATGHEMLKTELGIEMTHVPYNGSAPALSALLGNNVQLMVDVVSTSLPHIKAGKLKALAVTGSSRLDVLPNVPTVAESGYPNFRAATWFGLAVPAQTPPKPSQSCRPLHRTC